MIKSKQKKLWGRFGVSFDMRLLFRSSTFRPALHVVHPLALQLVEAKQISVVF